MELLTDFLRPTRSCACAAYRRLSRDVTSHYERAFRGSGLRATQFTILCAAAYAGALPMSKFAEVLGLERTTLSRNLALLEQRGLLRIDGADDARVRRVALTRAGETAVRDHFPRWLAAQESVGQILHKYGVTRGEG